MIGVLSLQGGFAKHLKMLQNLGASSCEVRKPEDLNLCRGLIIPGGESTTMLRQIAFIGMQEKLKEFAAKKPIFGTCAGLILLSSAVLNASQTAFSILDAEIERNAFGPQSESFIAHIEIPCLGDAGKEFPAVFIRAPRICKLSRRTEVLAYYQEEPVLIRQGLHLASSFHPELTNNPAVHRYFQGIVDQTIFNH